MAQSEMITNPKDEDLIDKGVSQEDEFVSESPADGRDESSAEDADDYVIENDDDESRVVKELASAYLSGDLDKVEEIKSKIAFKAPEKPGSSERRSAADGRLSSANEEKRSPQSKSPSQEEPSADSTQAISAADKEPDINSLPEDVRAYVESLKRRNAELLHQYKSREGRLSAQDRIIADLRRQFEALSKGSPATNSANSQYNGAQASSQVSQAVQDAKKDIFEEDEDLKALKDVDPDTASILEKYAERILRQAEERILNKIKPKIDSVEQLKYDHYIEQETQKLLRMVPNVREVMTYVDPETGYNPWQEWVRSAPESVRKLALSDRADDVYVALKLYAADMASIYGNRPENTRPQASNGAASLSDPARIQAARERKLTAPVASRQTGVATNSTAPIRKPSSFSELLGDGDLTEDEQEALFNEYVSRYEKEALEGLDFTPRVGPKRSQNSKRT